MSFDDTSKEMLRSFDIQQCQEIITALGTYTAARLIVAGIESTNDTTAANVVQRIVDFYGPHVEGWDE